MWDTSNALAKLGVNVFVVTTHLDPLLLKPHPRVKIYKVPFGHETTNLDQSTMMKIYLYSLPLLILKKIDVIYFPCVQVSSPFSIFRFGKVLVETAVETWDYSIPEYREELYVDRKLKFSEAGISPRKKTILERIFDKLTVWFYSFFCLNSEYPKNVDAFLCRTEGLRRHLASILGTTRLYVLPVGVNTEEFRPGGDVIKRDPGKIIFLFAGSISHRKGIFYLVEAFNRLSQKYSNVELWVVGQGAPETVEKLRGRIRPGAAVSWKGIVPLREIHRYVGACDVYINVSLVGEFVPVETSVTEAMACAKPAIVHKRPVYEDIRSETGMLLVEPKNVEDLYAVMEKLLLDPQLRKNIGERSRRCVEQKFTLEHAADTLYQIFHFLVYKN